MTRVVLLGPPGVGKGTQAGVLAVEIGVPAISTGDMFRHHIAIQSALGVTLRQIVSSGGLVPDETTSEIVAQRIAEPDAAEGFILDGYPRTAAQVDHLDAMLDPSAAELTRVVLLHAPEDVLVARLARRGAEQHREDDAPDIVRARLRTYADAIAPVVERYESRHLLTRVDADRAPRTVTDDLCAIVRAGVGGGLLA